MSRKLSYKFGLFATALTAAYAAPQDIKIVHAQQIALEEIVVTARRREESLMDIPLAITAFSADDLNSIGITSTVELSDFVPGFFMQDINAGRKDRGTRTLIFRGLNVATNSGVTASGTVFVDGAPLLSGAVQGMTDVERVEILRGPQSVYFGRATFAGAVNYITKTPGDEWTGKLDVDFGRFQSSDITFAVEGPVIEDKLAIRASTRQHNEGGDWLNFGYGDERLGDRSTQSYTLSVYATPTEQLDIRANLNYFEFDDGSPADVKFKPFDGFHNCMPGAPNRRFICGKLPDVSEFPASLISANTEITPELQRGVYDRLAEANSYFGADPIKAGAGLGRQGYQATLDITYEFANGMNFNAISAWHKDERQLLTDLTQRDTRNLPNPRFVEGQNFPRYIDWRFLVESFVEDWSQEVRLSSADEDRLRWTVGGTYVGAKQSGGGLIGHIPTRHDYVINPIFVHVDTYGVFGGLYYDLTEDLTLSAEARYQSDKRADENTGAGQTLEATFKSFNPRVTLDYKPTEDTTVYLQYAKGTRPGGFNTNFLSFSPTEQAAINNEAIVELAYDEEKLEIFELGLKGEFFDGRARGSVAVYRGTLSNQIVNQLITFIDDANNIRLQSFNINQGKTRLQGVEFEGTVQATENFRLSGQFAINDVTIRDFYCAPCLNNYTGSPDVRGNRLQAVPKTTGSISAEYQDELTSKMDGFIRIDGIYRGNQYVTAANLARVGEAFITNARFGLILETITLEGYVTNVFNDDTIPSSQIGVDVITFEQNEFRANLPDKRRYGIRASYSF